MSETEGANVFCGVLAIAGVALLIRAEAVVLIADIDTDTGEPGVPEPTASTVVGFVDASPPLATGKEPGGRGCLACL